MFHYSIIVCTYNRASFLKETIDSILKNLSAKTNYELLIVDNNSTDNTLEIVSQYSRFSFIKYFLEKQQGLSFARNRGIREAKNEIIVFLDDDIDIDSGYLDILDQLYKDANTYIVGGKVLPYQTRMPDWLSKKYQYLASVYDLGDQPCQPTKLMGANHTFRKELTQKVGLYNTSLGPIGNYKIGGDEDDFLLRAQKIGYKLLYHPDLIVYHKIANRLNEPFIYRYANNIGRSQAKIDRQHKKIRFVLKAIKSSLMIIMYYIYGMYVHTPSQRVGFTIDKYLAAGYLAVFSSS